MAKNIFIRLFVVILLGAAVAPMIVAVPQGAAASKVLDWNGAQIQWRSMPDGLREAQRTGKPIVAVFYADWCPQCAAHASLFRDAEVVRKSRDVVMVKVNGDDEPDLSARYSPDGGYIPRTMVLRPDGKLVEGIHGGGDEYKYFLDHSNTRELLDVMKRAASVGAGR